MSVSGLFVSLGSAGRSQQRRACHNPSHALRNLQEKWDLNGNYFPTQYKLSSDVCGLFTPVSWRLCLGYRFCLLPPSERLRRSAFEALVYLFIHFVLQKWLQFNMHCFVKRLSLPMCVTPAAKTPHDGNDDWQNTVKMWNIITI